MGFDGLWVKVMPARPRVVEDFLAILVVMHLGLGAFGSWAVDSLINRDVE